jgi:hypothetical protein
LLCLSNALTLPSNFLPFLSEIRTWVLFRTEAWRTESGPWETSYSSSWRTWSSDKSDLGRCRSSLNGKEGEKDDVKARGGEDESVS